MISRELLYRAWPQGLLPMRGVHSLGGWHCVSASFRPNSQPQYHSFWLAPDMVSLYGLARDKEPTASVLAYGSANSLDVTPATQALASGELLPVVDPKDTGTWACLVEDLAACVHAYVPNSGLYLAREGDGWCLKNRWCSGPGEGLQAFPGINTDNAALALVLARIQVREQTSARVAVASEDADPQRLRDRALGNAIAQTYIDAREKGDWR